MKVCFESSGGERLRPRMAIVEGRQFDKSREILLTGSKRATKVYRIKRADA